MPPFRPLPTPSAAFNGNAIVTVLAFFHRLSLPQRGSEELNTDSRTVLLAYPSYS